MPVVRCTGTPTVLLKLGCPLHCGRACSLAEQAPGQPSSLSEHGRAGSALLRRHGAPMGAPRHWQRGRAAEPLSATACPVLARGAQPECGRGGSGLLPGTVPGPGHHTERALARAESWPEAHWHCRNPESGSLCTSPELITGRNQEPDSAFGSSVAPASVGTQISRITRESQLPEQGLRRAGVVFVSVGRRAVVLL